MGGGGRSCSDSRSWCSQDKHTVACAPLVVPKPRGFATRTHPSFVVDGVGSAGRARAGGLRGRHNRLQLPVVIVVVKVDAL